MTAIFEIDDLIDAHNKITKANNDPDDIDKKIVSLVRATIKEFLATAEKNILETQSVQVCFSSKRDATKTICRTLGDVINLTSDKIADMLDALEEHKKQLLKAKKNPQSTESLSELLMLVNDFILDEGGIEEEEGGYSQEEEDEDEDDDDEYEDRYIPPTQQQTPIMPKTAPLLPPKIPAINRVQKMEEEAEEMRRYVYERNQMLQKIHQQNVLLKEQAQALSQQKNNQPMQPNIQPQQQQPQPTEPAMHFNDDDWLARRKEKRLRYYEENPAQVEENNHNNANKTE